MSTRVIPRANTVRTNFNKAVEGRVEKLVEMATKNIDTKLRAHFDKALASGEEPYPPPNYELTLTVLDAKDFAGGNEPEAMSAFETLREGTPDAEKLTKTLTEMLKSAGFEASVWIEGDKTVQISVYDPEFQDWAYSNNVDSRARQTVQETLASRRQKELEARAKEIVPAIADAVKKSLRDAVAQTTNWSYGTSISVDVKKLAPYVNGQADVIEAACELATKSLSTKATTVSVYHNGHESIGADVTYNSENAHRAFQRSLAK